MKIEEMHNNKWKYCNHRIETTKTIVILLLLYLFMCLNNICYGLSCVNQKLAESQIIALQDFYNSSNNTDYWIYQWNYTALCWNISYLPYGVSTIAYNNNDTEVCFVCLCFNYSLLYY